MSEMTRKTLCIIGGGKVGKSLGRLWASHNIFTIQQVLNQSQQSATEATEFIGAGQAIESFASLRCADIYMIATSDSQITASSHALAQTGNVRPGTIVFHCSGTLSSNELHDVQTRGAAVASVHPIRSFAAPSQVVENFPGTYCGVEGDSHALAILNEGFSAIGAQIIALNSGNKILYHSAAVFACNYLVTLLDVAQQTYVQSGIHKDVALKLMEPLVRETVENVFSLGLEKALTGPIARGDKETALRQSNALSKWNKEISSLYKRFMTLTAKLAGRRFN